VYARLSSKNGARRGKNAASSPAFKVASDRVTAILPDARVPDARVPDARVPDALVAVSVATGVAAGAGVEVSHSIERLNK